MTLLRAGLVALLSSVLLLAQDCSRCQGSGLIPCKDPRHAVKRCCGVAFPHRCTARAKAPCCRGLERKPCPGCKGVQGLDAVRTHEEKARRWLDATSRWDRSIGARFQHVETDRIRLHFSIPSWTIAREDLGRRAAAHRFAKRAHEAALAYEKLCGLRPPKTVHLFCVNDLREMDAARRALSMPPASRAFDPDVQSDHSAFARKDGQAFWLFWPGSDELTDDAGLHAFLVHNLAHLCALGAATEQGSLPPWLDTGLAHALAFERLGSRGDGHSFCYLDPNGSSPWLRVRSWPKQLRRAMAGGEEVKLEVLRKGTRRHFEKPEEHAFCWAWAEFLRREKNAGLSRFTRACVQGKDDPWSVLEGDARARRRRFLSSLAALRLPDR